MTNGIFREKFGSSMLYTLLNFFFFLKLVLVCVNNPLFCSGTKFIQIRTHKARRINKALKQEMWVSVDIKISASSPRRNKLLSSRSQ
jgi:hypothetical protein